MKRKKIGTNAIESSIRKLCGKGPGREEILELVLRNRINEKYKEMRKNRYNCIKIWRENDDILIQESILEGFLVIWSKEKMRYRRKLKEKLTKKIGWLEQKYQKKVTPLPDEYEGYSFKDKELGAEFDTPVIIL